MHKYVLEEELFCNPTVKELVEKGYIEIIDYNDFLNPRNKSDYEDKFNNFYKTFNSQEFSGNIYTYRHAGENLGEIRSSLMAWYLGIEILMSDDKAAKYYVTERLSSRRRKIYVYNVYDILITIGQKNDKKIRWEEVKATAKAAFGTSDKYNDIVNVWQQS